MDSKSIAIIAPEIAKIGETKNIAIKLLIIAPAIWPSIFFVLFNGDFVFPKAFPTRCDIGSAKTRIIIEASAIFKSNNCNARREPVTANIIPLPGRVFLSFFLSKLSKNQEINGILIFRLNKLTNIPIVNVMKIIRGVIIL